MTSPQRPFQSYPLDIEERRQGRRQVKIAVRVAEAATVHIGGFMTDVSEYGCRISAERQTVVGRLVRIDVSEFTTFSGWVVWSSGDAMGIDFSNPLRTEVIDHLERISAGIAI